MTPELSRPVRLDTLGGGARAITIVADAAERAALAARFGLIALDGLEADAEVTREGEAVIAVGRLRAAAVQACVASGEPVIATIDEPFALRFVPEGKVEGDEVELDATDLDEITYAGGALDLGEAVAQSLGLALNPFPRAPQADQVLRAAGVIGEVEAGPFGALKDMLGGSARPD